MNITKETLKEFNRGAIFKSLSKDGLFVKLLSKHRTNSNLFRGIILCNTKTYNDHFGELYKPFNEDLIGHVEVYNLETLDGGNFVLSSEEEFKQHVTSNNKKNTITEKLYLINGKYFIDFNKTLSNSPYIIGELVGKVLLTKTIFVDWAVEDLNLFNNNNIPQTNDIVTYSDNGTIYHYRVSNLNIQK